MLDEVKFKNEIYNILALETPLNTNYITLENIKKEKNDKRYIYIIQIKDKKSLYIVKLLILI